MNKNLTLADDACETIRNVCIISSARNGIYLFVYFWLDCVALIGLFVNLREVLITNLEHYFCLMS